MRRARSFLTLAALAAVGVGLVGQAAAAETDAWAASRLGKTRLGETWMGASLAREDLRGQVVLLEFWGYRCPPCIASIPHMTKLDRQYGRHGLVVIGAHAQGDKGEAKTEAIAIARKRGASYTIMSRAHVPEANFRGIPHVFVFDHTGKVVYEGHPMDKQMDRTIVAALKRRPHPILGEMKYRELRAAASEVKAGRLGQAWKLCAARKDAEGPAGEEARFLLGRLDRHAQRVLTRTEGCRKDSPGECMEMLTELRKQYAGSPHGDAAAKRLEALGAEKEFQVDLKAERMLRPIERAVGKIPPRPDDRAAQSSWKRRYGSAARQIKGRVESMKKQYPDSQFTQKAEELLARLTGKG